MDKREGNAERKGKRGRTVWCRSHDSDPGKRVLWEDGDSTDSGGWEDSSRPASPFDHGEGHDDLFGPRLVPLDGARTERKVRKRSHSSSTGSSSKDTTSPSVFPVADGSDGGKEAGSKTVSGRLHCKLFDHVKGCNCPCTPLEHTPSCKCEPVADVIDRSLKHITREAILNGEHLIDSDDEQ